jgi:hypothetical protein
VIDACANVIIIDSIRLVTGTESRKGNKEVIEEQTKTKFIHKDAFLGLNPGKITHRRKNKEK